jgi:hypothetical protein
MESIQGMIKKEFVLFRAMVAASSSQTQHPACCRHDGRDTPTESGRGEMRAAPPLFWQLAGARYWDGTIYAANTLYVV